MSKRTEGPWEVARELTQLTIWAKKVRIVAYCRFDDNPEAEGNAQAIAVLPDLLVALETLVAIVGLTAFKNENQRAVLQEAVDMANAALANAKGA